MKSDIKNFKQLFHIEDEGRIGGNESVYTFVSKKKNGTIDKSVIIPFGFRKGKTGN